MLQIKTASLCIKSGEKAGFDTAMEEVVASQRDVATDVVDLCQRQGLCGRDAKKLTGIDTTWRGVIRLCDSSVYRHWHGRCQWLRGLWPLASWGCGFESRRTTWMSVCCGFCVFPGIDLCDEPIPCPEKSYRPFLFATECDRGKK
jgi:hypothetical protein